MLKKNELKLKDFLFLKKFAIKKNIKILFSVFDIKSLKNLNEIGFNYIKIPSGEITNYLLLKKIAKFNKFVFLSTGMCTIKEISDAINLLIKNGTKKNKITILHCNTEYPSPISDINMNVLKLFKEKFKLNFGYSDHSNRIEVPIVAVSLGASCIEKHITLNNKMRGPDHSASLNPDKFKQMCIAIRNTEIILGNKSKRPTKSEIKNIKIVRKSLVASKFIRKGEIFTLSNITAKRPGNGISPMKIKYLIGKRAKKNFKIDEIIKI